MLTRTDIIDLAVGEIVRSKNHMCGEVEYQIAEVFPPVEQTNGKTARTVKYDKWRYRGEDAWSYLFQSATAYKVLTEGDTTHWVPDGQN